MDNGEDQERCFKLPVKGVKRGKYPQKDIVASEFLLTVCTC